jgi:hypothetical protein
VSAREDVASYWDETIAAWLEPGWLIDSDLSRWADSYRGTGPGAVDFDVMPEPYIGSLSRTNPALVLLGLNPGQGDPDFQGRHGFFQQDIRKAGYSSWAAAAPYTSEAWESAHGRNKYHRDRVAFAQRLTGDASIAARDLLLVELYPFHSRRVTAVMAPPGDLLNRFILAPIAELDVEFVFAFGKPWVAAAAAMGLGSPRELPIPWTASGRRALSFRLNREQQLIVMHQSGYSGPPGEADTAALQRALGY